MWSGAKRPGRAPPLRGPPTDASVRYWAACQAARVLTQGTIRPVNLDVNTLLALMLANVFAMAVAVPVVMGWRVSPAARHVLASAVAQALAWGSFLLALPVHDQLFSTLWVAP